ncbi:MAG: DUF1858 domain-containing protein [archaeon]
MSAKKTTKKKTVKKPVKKDTKQHVNKDMTIGEVVQKYPASAVIMMGHGMHCIGCHVAAWETIEQGCKGHGMDDEQIAKMIDEINAVIEKNK